MMKKHNALTYRSRADEYADSLKFYLMRKEDKVFLEKEDLKSRYNENTGILWDNLFMQLPETLIHLAIKNYDEET
jgi:hypothetical protein